MKTFILISMCLFSLSLLASESRKAVKLIATCDVLERDNYKVKVYRNETAGLPFSYTAHFIREGVATVIGPTTETLVDEANAFIIVFNKEEVAFKLVEGRSTEGAATGRVGGEALVCNVDLK